MAPTTVNSLPSWTENPFPSPFSTDVDDLTFETKNPFYIPRSFSTDFEFDDLTFQTELPKEILSRLLDAFSNVKPSRTPSESVGKAKRPLPQIPSSTEDPLQRAASPMGGDSKLNVIAAGGPVSEEESHGLNDERSSQMGSTAVEDLPSWTENRNPFFIPRSFSTDVDDDLTFETKNPFCIPRSFSTDLDDDLISGTEYPGLRSATSNYSPSWLTEYQASPKLPEDVLSRFQDAFSNIKPSRTPSESVGKSKRALPQIPLCTEGPQRTASPMRDDSKLDAIAPGRSESEEESHRLNDGRSVAVEADCPSAAGMEDDLRKTLDRHGSPSIDVFSSDINASPTSSESVGLASMASPTGQDSEWEVIDSRSLEEETLFLIEEQPVVVESDCPSAAEMESA